MSFYPADLAAIHDAGFGEFGRAAAAELLERLPGSGRVVELGCGTGITGQILSTAGYDVVGIDISEDMLALARRRVPNAEFRQGSAWTAPLERCNAVTAIGEVLNYAADPAAGAAQLPALFARIRAALEPGGLLMFDFATPGRGSLRSGGPSVVEGSDWRIVSDTHEDPATRCLERRMTIEYGGSTRTETHVLNLYEPGDIERSLGGSGFSTERLKSYAGLGFWPGYAAFAATAQP